MRPACVYATVPADAHPDLLAALHGRWRVATRLVMIVLSARGLPAAQVAELLGYHPRTVRRWVHRYQRHGIGGLADRPRPGRPRLGGPKLAQRILRLLVTPRAWTIARLWQRLGRPAISQRTLHRRVGEVARWRRPRLVAKGDPDRDQILADLHQRIRDLPDGAMVLAEDEAHINLLAWVRATWIPKGTRQQVMTLGPTGAAPSSARSSLPPAASCTGWPARPSAPASPASASSCWPPTRPRRWWWSSATT